MKSLMQSVLGNLAKKEVYYILIIPLALKQLCVLLIVQLLLNRLYCQDHIGVEFHLLLKLDGGSKFQESRARYLVSFIQCKCWAMRLANKQSDRFTRSK